MKSDIILEKAKGENELDPDTTPPSSMKVLQRVMTLLLTLYFAKLNGRKSILVPVFKDEMFGVTKKPHC